MSEFGNRVVVVWQFSMPEAVRGDWYVQMHVPH